MTVGGPMSYSTVPAYHLEKGIERNSNCQGITVVGLQCGVCILIGRVMQSLVCVTSDSVQLCQQLLPTNGITAASSTLPFQLLIVPDQPYIRANETKHNPNTNSNPTYPPNPHVAT